MCGMRVRIKELRVAAGLSQQQLADMAGISKGYLSEMERGVKQINANRLEGIARALNTEPHLLILSSDDPEDIQFQEDLGKLKPEQRRTIREMVAGFAKANEQAP
jgi:transcriptional regulator with XRE-family HTH domain